MRSPAVKCRFRCGLCSELARGIFRGALRNGKQALAGGHRDIVSGDIDCSVNIEEALAVNQRRRERIFDYLVVDRDRCGMHFIDVHPASSTGNVQEMVEKRQGTAGILARMGIDTGDARWHWIVGGRGRICFKANDKFGKILAQNCIGQPRRVSPL
jgi:hypothetical protein